MKRYVKADEIRYTRPDGKDSVVNTDYGYEYVIKEIEDVMGHDFAYSVRQMFEDYESDAEYFKNEIKDSFDDLIGGLSDTLSDLTAKVVDMRRYVNDNKESTQRDIDTIDDIVDLVASVNSEVDYFIDGINEAFDESMGY